MVRPLNRNILCPKFQNGYLFVFKIYLIVFERQIYKEKRRERREIFHMLILVHCPRWPQWSELNWSEARNRSFFWVCHVATGSQIRSVNSQGLNWYSYEMLALAGRKLACWAPPVLRTSQYRLILPKITTSVKIKRDSLLLPASPGPV